MYYKNHPISCLHYFSQVWPFFNFCCPTCLLGRYYLALLLLLLLVVLYGIIVIIKALTIVTEEQPKFMDNKLHDADGFRGPV